MAYLLFHIFTEDTCWDQDSKLIKIIAVASRKSEDQSLAKFPINHWQSHLGQHMNDSDSTKNNYKPKAQSVVVHQRLDREL